jgi:hemimethylated DNA binding protein
VWFAAFGSSYAVIRTDERPWNCVSVPLPPMAVLATEVTPYVVLDKVPRQTTAFPTGPHTSGFRLRGQSMVDGEPLDAPTVFLAQHNAFTAIMWFFNHSSSPARGLVSDFLEYCNTRNIDLANPLLCYRPLQVLARHGRTLNVRYVARTVLRTVAGPGLSTLMMRAIFDLDSPALNGELPSVVMDGARGTRYTMAEVAVLVSFASNPDPSWAFPGSAARAVYPSMDDPVFEAVTAVGIARRKIHQLGLQVQRATPRVVSALDAAVILESTVLRAFGDPEDLSNTEHYFSARAQALDTFDDEMGCIPVVPALVFASVAEYSPIGPYVAPINAPFHFLLAYRCFADSPFIDVWHSRMRVSLDLLVESLAPGDVRLFRKSIQDEVATVAMDDAESQRNVMVALVRRLVLNGTVCLELVDRNPALPCGELGSVLRGSVMRFFVNPEQELVLGSIVDKAVREGLDPTPLLHRSISYSSTEDQVNQAITMRRRPELMLGAVCRHVVENYRCVIVSVDDQCQLDEMWQMRNGVTPDMAADLFYSCLVDCRDRAGHQVTYVPQRHLEREAWVPRAGWRPCVPLYETPTLYGMDSSQFLDSLDAGAQPNDEDPRIHHVSTGRYFTDYRADLHAYEPLPWLTEKFAKVM